MDYQLKTLCVQGEGENAGEHFGAVSFPIYQTATFAHPALGEDTGYAYGRVGNPTRDDAEKRVALLEKGVRAFGFSTGMAAISALMELFSAGDHLVATDDLYGGTHRLFDKISAKNGLSVTFADSTNANMAEAAIRPETKAIFIETPTNPMMKVTDLKAVSAIARKHNCLLIVDNTFMTPYFQQPLDLGADVVVHSATKYLGGHNDTLAGFAVVKDRVLADKIELIYKTTGACLSPFDSWLIARGLKTLALRMEQHQKNALLLAQWLKAQPQVKEVYYIGLEDHPSYELVRKQCSGYGGMISFRVDRRETAKQLLERVKLIRFAESLGGVESLLTYPMTQTHAEVPKERRTALGVDETLLRLSVGIEDARDLIWDLEQAFK